jgi:heterotetrameric sarcosine oxidase gamma subunit
MTALSFLAPDASEVAARTPMHRLAIAAGARTGARDGWEVAVSYSGDERARLTETVAFADRSQLCKLELQAEPEALAALVSEASGGVVLQPRLATPSDAGVWWCPVAPARVLALCEPPSAAELRAAVAGEAERAPSTVTVAEVTSGLAAITLVGPGAAELLARFCAIDVRPTLTPVAGFRPGSIARTPGYLLREREDELLVMVGWALGAYLYEVVADAAGHLGGGPVGADALAEHREAFRA